RRVEPRRAAQRPSKSGPFRPLHADGLVAARQAPPARNWDAPCKEGGVVAHLANVCFLVRAPNGDRQLARRMKNDLAVHKGVLRLLFAGAAIAGALFPPALEAQAILVQTNAIWKFLDDGSDQGIAWRAPGFIDGTWDEGPAELGFGDASKAAPRRRYCKGDSSPTTSGATSRRRTWRA